MPRELFVARNNELKDKLEVSADAGVTYSAVDLTAASNVILQIYDKAGTAIIEVTGKASFTLDALGNAKWQPGASDVTASHLGIHHVRWIVVTANEPEGVIFEAESDVEIKR
jgi:hypothetical protein